MEKEFVSYEISLDLKKLGFDKECFAIYNTEQDFLYIKPRKLFGDIKAPLYQQAFKWFREKHNLHPSFTRYRTSSTKKESNIFTHIYEIHIIDENNDFTINVGDFNSYKEAELECLKKLIEIVKNK